MAGHGCTAYALVLVACTGEIQSENLEGLPPQEAVSLQLWGSKALPIFLSKCMMCHDGSMPNIGYLAGASDLEKRDTLLNYNPRVVNLDATQSSRVLTKGRHTGPELEVKEANDVLLWINAEAAARPEVPPIRTAQTVPMLCTGGAPGTPTCPINTIDLSGLGVAGSFELVVESLADATYATNLKFKAGAEGLYLEHPLFETWSAGATDPKPDPIDRFFAVVLNLAPNAESVLGGGEATLQGFVATDPMSLRFDVIEKQRP